MILYRGRALRVCVVGGDNQGWALDTEMRLACGNLTQLCEVVDHEKEADVLHSVWPENTAVRWNAEQCSVPIVLSFSNEPFRLAERPRILPLMGSALALIAQSTEAYRQLERMGARNRFLVPYPCEWTDFGPRDRNDASIVQLRAKLEIPPEAYVVGNFFRDTAGSDLKSPKRQKGPDVFAAMMAALKERIAPRRLVVLLAGPRRHWIRRRLEEQDVEHRFCGQNVEGDDNPANILERHTLSLLYNLCDIQVVPSRWEGGPRAIMECALTHTAVISRPVGIAPDVLPSELLFETADAGVDLLARDVRCGFVQERKGRVAENLERFSSREIVVPRLREVYGTAAQLLESGGDTDRERRRRVLYPEYAPRTFLGRVRRFAIRGSRRILAPGVRRSGLEGTIVLWSNFRPPPYGGANQFLLALEKALQRRGFTVLRNDWRAPAYAHIFNSMSFDYAHVAQLRRLHPRAAFVHRIDGPMSRYRGTDPSENDDIIFGINKVMDATVFQSAYSLCGCKELGYEPVFPSIVRNSVDPDIFHAKPKVERSAEDRIRLLSTSWSDNPRKGRDTFLALDKTLDFHRYEYRFIGRCGTEFKNIQATPPKPSEQIAKALREADIFIFASAFESASNALTESLACGTPVIYLDSGGNAEIVGPAGLAFREDTEVPPLVDRMARNLGLFRESISIPSIDEIAGSYLAVIENVRADSKAAAA